MQLFSPFRISSDIPTNFLVLLPECIFRVKEKREITAVKNHLQLHKPALDYTSEPALHMRSKWGLISEPSSPETIS